MAKLKSGWFLVALALTLSSSVAVADQGGQLQVLLRGKYDYVGTENCVDTAYGFSEDDFLIPQGPSVNAVSHFRGTMTFDGQGNAVSSGTSMTANDDPLNNPQGFSIFSGDFTCSYEYIVNPDRSFTMAQQQCDVIGVKGAPGVAIKITGGIAQGQIGQHSDTLQTASANPVRQYMTFDGNEAFVITRLCSAAITFQRARSNNVNTR